MSELKKEKRQQAGAKEKSLLTAERKNERERERGREKLWWKKRVGRARQITHFEKNNNAGHVFRVVFFHTWKNRHVDVLKNWHISNFTNEEGQSLNKITTTFFVETRADQIIHTFNEEQTKENRTSGNWIWGAKRLKLKQKILKMFPLENLTSQITILFLLKL